MLSSEFKSEVGVSTVVEDGGAGGRTGGGTGVSLGSEGSVDASRSKSFKNSSSDGEITLLLEETVGTGLFNALRLLMLEKRKEFLGLRDPRLRRNSPEDPISSLSNTQVVPATYPPVSATDGKLVDRPAKSPSAAESS